jgi:ABC-2 type transport system ATP-binding protein
MISVKGITAYYGRLQALWDVSLEVGEGELVALVGPNGAGKTTTIKMIVGLLQPTSGSVKVGGFDLQEQPIQAKAVCGYLPDTPHLYPKLSARELLRFVGDLYEIDHERIERRSQEMLSLFELSDAADDPIDTYSHGMQQKTALASALLHDPQVLVMDEPTVGLDPRSARLIKDILRQLAQRGAAIFLSTHILEIAERMCDRIGIINDGKLIAVGTMQELRTMGKGETSLEEIFLNLTGGAEYAEIAEVLK